VTWEELLRAVVLGTERAPLGEDDPETAVLRAASVLSLTRRVNRPLPAPKACPFSAAPAEEAEAVGATAARLLEQMLAGHHEEVLPGFLAAVAERGRLVPPEALPALLERGRSADRERVIRVMGRRGAWLAAQNEDWRYALDAARPASELWQTARAAERLTLLRGLRPRDPAGARALVESTWAVDAGEERASYLALFLEGLGDDDEPFLEAALDDRRREVRRNAAEVLAHLPSSRLVGRMIARVDALSRYGVDPGAPRRLAEVPAVFLEFPRACDEAMIRDGVEPRLPSRLQSIGERTWWLIQMLRCVPPGHFRHRFGVSAEGLVAAVHSSEWAVLLGEALTLATARFGDVEQARALLVHGPSTELFEVLGPAEREERALEALRPPLRDGHPAIPMMLGCRFPWSVPLGQAFVRAVRATIAAGAAGTGQCRDLLAEAGRWFPPSQAEFAALGWPPTERVPARPWLDAYDRFLAEVSFRASVLAALDA
jgi:hypothetical protein